VAGTEPYWHAEKKQEVKASMTVDITHTAYLAHKPTYDAAFKATIVATVCSGTMCTAADVVIAVTSAGRRLVAVLRRLATGANIKVDYEIKGLEPNELQSVFSKAKDITSGQSTFTSRLTTEFNALATAAGIPNITQPTISDLTAPRIEADNSGAGSTPTMAPTKAGVNAGTSASLSAFVAFIPILYALSSTAVQ
jgi:hypothetical protein